MLNIVEGKEHRALKFVVYGPEGIGKSTFASQFPEPLFIDTESGTVNLNVRRIKCSKSWDELIAIVKEIIATPTICKTLVLDTADWSEILCINAVCEKYRKSNIEDFGFGKGYTYLSDEFSKLLVLLDKVIEAGINVVVTAHGKPRKFELPDEMGQFDRYEMKLSKQVAPLLKEWCDALLFANYKTFLVTTENNTKKAQGGKRVLYTSHHPCWDAKNRFNLPEELDLDFKGIAHLFTNESKKTVAEPTAVAQEERLTINKLKSLIVETQVSEENVAKLVAKRGYYASGTKIQDYSDDFITRWIIPNWEKIVEAIKPAEAEGEK